MSSTDTKFAFFSDNKGVGDLKSKNEIELKEMLDRQNHLLSNKALINKLKDKGEKIRKVRDEILEALKSLKSKVKDKKQKNSTAAEWREDKKDSDSSDIDDKDDPDALKILSENGLVPKQKSHINRLIEKEKDPDFSYRPYTSAVAEKIKNVIPEAHTAKSSPSLIKTIHLEESLTLLSNQMSALKILGSRSKRVEECIHDRINESAQEHEQENDETDEQESKAGLNISVNIND